jgi:RNA polymerase sigma-70 factor (ECF subfamily)
MNHHEPEAITVLLQRWSDGDAKALEELAPIVQTELRRLARHYLRSEKNNHLLESAALVNEAWLRLINWKHTTWKNRAQFFGATAKIMRHILVDEARRRLRRGGNFQVSLSKAAGAAVRSDEELIALDEALKSLANFDQRKCQLVEMRYFSDMKLDEIAAVMQISTRQVQRELSAAKSWLYRELRKGKGKNQQGRSNDS